jgi:hypothetical protein
MTTYNATTFSATTISADLELYFELTDVHHPHSCLLPEFHERWSDYIVKVIKERIWSYDKSVMTTDLGNEQYEGGDDHRGLTLRDTYTVFAKMSDSVAWNSVSNNWTDAEDDTDDEDEDDTDDSENDTIPCYDCGEECDPEDIVCLDEFDVGVCKECLQVTRADLDSRPRFTYKCRVECQDDIDRIMGKCQRMMREGGRFTTKEIIPQFIGLMPLPDKEWVFTSHLDLSGVRSIFGQVTDAHVALQTVQLEENYTGDRDYTLR